MAELLGAGPGEQASMTMMYEAPGAAVRRDDVWEYRLGFLPQPALRPGALSLKIILPEGAGVLGVAPGLIVDDGIIRFVGTPTVSSSFWVRYA